MFRFWFFFHQVQDASQQPFDSVSVFLILTNSISIPSYFPSLLLTYITLSFATLCNNKPHSKQFSNFPLNQMIRISLPHIILFLVVLPANLASANDQPASQPVAPTPLRENLNPSFAVVVVALVCAFLFVGFFSMYLRQCSDTYLTAGNPVRATVDCSSCGPRGIDPKLLDTFPILVYSTIKDLKIGREALECAVCLGEFEDHETLRLLPKCSHVFHPDCIDTWLSSHVTCPVCRSKLKPEQCGENEVAIVIPNETDAHQVLGESSVSRSEPNSAEEQEQPGAPNVSDGERRILVNLGRSHSTGHSLCEPGKKMERYTLRLPEEARKQILANHGGIRRSASYDVFWGWEWSSRKGYRNEGEGSSRGKQTRRLVLSMTPPFVSRGYVAATCSAVPRFWASSSCPLHPL